MCIPPHPKDPKQQKAKLLPSASPHSFELWPCLPWLASPGAAWSLLVCPSHLLELPLWLHVTQRDRSARKEGTGR